MRISSRLQLLAISSALIGTLAACGNADERPTRDPVIKVDFRGVAYDFVLNEAEVCGTLEDGTPYVEAKWVRAPLLEKDPPFYIKGGGGWEGRTYTEPHTWIYGVYENERSSQKLGFAIHGEERPGFNEDGTFFWSGPTGISGDMTVEVICP